MTDTVTILQTKGKLAAAKRIWLPEGGEPRFQDYDNPKHFTVHERGVGSLHELAELLEKIEKQRQYLIIRGRPRDGIDRQNAVRRVHSNGTDHEAPCFEPAARQWIPLDFDAIPCPEGLDPISDPEGAVQYLSGLLPEPFHDVSCWWQHTSGAGIKRGIRMRLFFWGSRTLTDQELKTWLVGAPVDRSIYNPVQAIYVANPIIEQGVDPVPIRSGTFSGNREIIEVPPEIVEPSDPRHEQRPGTEPRADIADIEAALEAIPNENLSWERWNNTGMATWGASGGSEEGYAAFERWSRKSQKFNEDNTRARWEDYGKYPPCKLGFGTLVHMAREAQPGWRIPSRGVSLDDFYAYMPMHNYIFAPARETWPAASINARLPQVFVGVDREGKPKYIPASKWLDRHKPVEQMTWAPGSPMIIGNRLISNGGWIERAKVSCFNLYVPPNIEPGDASKAQPWLDHIGKIYPDHAEHTIKWLAHRVQRPEEKTNHALVLGGGQGIGKDTLLEPVKRAVGPWNFHEVSPQQIVGRFNGFLKSVILRINEARDLGDIDRFKFYDHMKAYTAAPPDVLRVDEKNLREHYVVNCCAVIITTNYKTNGIYLPADDRRHYVAWSDLVKEDFSKTYWDDLWRWYDTGGCRHVAAYLAGLDLSSFDAKAPPPKTQTFWEIVDASRAPEDAELSDVLDKLEWPKTVTIAQIADKAESDFYDWLRDRKNFRRIPHRMEACGYVAVRNDGAGDGLWKVDGKRQVIYAKAELSLADRLDCATKRAATK